MICELTNKYSNSRSLLGGNQVLAVGALVHKATLHFEAIVDAALHLLHAQQGALRIPKLHEDRTNLSTQARLPRPNHLELAQLPDVLHFSFEIVAKFFVVVNGHGALTVVDA